MTPRIVLVILALAGSGLGQSPQFPLQRGINISHWLSQSDRRGDARGAFFQERHVQQIAGWGFDHIRIPIDEEQMWDEQNRAHPRAFRLLQSALSWCEKYELRAIVDLHILRSHHFNAKEKPLWTDPTAQERFFQLWVELSDSLQRWPTSMVAYELMNEPVADHHKEWNKLVDKATAVIRDKESERFVVIGSNRWQSVHTFDSLRVPENDPYIILSFHCYHPMPLTHYKASWTGVGRYTGPVKYPGLIIDPTDLAKQPADIVNMMQGHIEVWNRAKLEALLAKPLALAKKTGLSLYCGEWGAITNAPRTDRLQWYRDMKVNLENHGIGWATWDFKSNNFGLIGYDETVDETLKTILSSH
jgi:endoglucanase